MADTTDTTDPKTEALKDGGYSSRKLALVIWTQALIVIAAALTGKWPALGVNLPTVVAGLIGAAGLYITGNVVAKHVLGKQFDVTAKADATDEK